MRAQAIPGHFRRWSEGTELKKRFGITGHAVPLVEPFEQHSTLMAAFLDRWATVCTVHSESSQCTYEGIFFDYVT